MSKAQGWPETKEEPCQWCGKVLRMVRKGVAPEYHKGLSAPKRGTGYYYSVEAHDCPRRDAIGKQLKASQAQMERAIFGGRRGSR